MTNELVRRLKILDTDADHLGNYRISSDYGYPSKELRGLTEEISKDFPRAYSHYDVRKGATDSDVDFEKLSFWEETVKEIGNTIRMDSRYQSLVRAYNSNDQAEISRLLREVFDMKRLQSTSEDTPETRRLRKRPFYHGVFPRKTALGQVGIDFETECPPIDEFISPDDYIDRCLTIMSEGLKPSMGAHTAPMDRNIMPVYLVDSPSETHGLLMLELMPQAHGFDVWCRVPGPHHSIAIEEMVVYSPALKVPMTLGLKSANFLRKYGDQGPSLDGETSEEKSRIKELLSYRGHVERRLSDRKIDFKLVRTGDSQ
jgi:hypothetical protein